MILMRSAAWPLAIGLFALILAGAACGDDDSGASGSAKDALGVEASFYPLQWMAERVGGDRVEVSSLTPPGAEPHDLELTPSDVAGLIDADVVVYLDGFQPAVDDAVTEADADKVFDATEFADLSLTFTPIEEGEEAGEESGSVDPHFWLDPTRFATVATAFADFLGDLDPDGADAYAENAGALETELERLDAEFEAGLAACESTDLVTSHNAFGYLADRYGLEQVAITGLTPDDEPSPSDLAAVTDFVAENRVRTIYFETLVSPDIAEAIAEETGARTAVLDPIEGLDDASEGEDYLEIMRANLANLRTGQPCP